MTRELSAPSGGSGGSDRAVSPVIGVILMVAITVILAAVIGTFVLDLGDSVRKNVQAGASVDSSAGDDVAATTWTSNQNADYVNVTLSGGGLASPETIALCDVGDRVEWGSASSSTTSSGACVAGTNTPAATVADGETYTVTVTAVAGHQKTVVVTKDIEL